MHKNKCIGIFGVRVQSILFGFTCVEKIFEKKENTVQTNRGCIAWPELRRVYFNFKDRSLEKNFESEMSEQRPQKKSPASCWGEGTNICDILQQFSWY